MIQVCYDPSNYGTKEREMGSLVKASKELPYKKLIMVTDDYDAEESVDGRKITLMPLWKWLLG